MARGMAGTLVLGALTVGLAIAMSWLVSQALAQGWRPPAPDLWTGENLRLSSVSWLQLNGEPMFPRRGFVYLTDLRLLWNPVLWNPTAPLAFGIPAPVESQSVRLTHITNLHMLKETGLFRAGLRFTADGDDYTLYFQWGRLGPRSAAPVWLEAIRASTNASQKD